MADDLLGELLRRVSRSFYLSLRILPRDVREPLGLAYLLARAADTVADTRLVARGERLAHLETLRAAFRGTPADVSAVARAAAPFQTLAAERRLLERVGDAIRLRPVDLREPAPRQRARALYDRLLVRALGHYDDGWNYTLAIPALEWRMRLACAWPLAIGLATLAALAAHPDPMGATSPIKISRAQVRGLHARSTLVAWSNRGLADLAERLRRRIILPAAGA